MIAMLRSMTGYGRSVHKLDNNSVTVEIKTVNHRFCEVQTRLPKQWLFLEEKVRSWCRETIKRGKSEVSVFLQEDSLEKNVHINWSLLEQFQHQFEEMKKRTGADEPFPIAAMLQHSEIAYVAEEPADAAAVEEFLEQAVKKAVNDLDQMRIAEGKVLTGELERRMLKTASLNSEIEDFAPQVIENFRQRLYRRMEDFLSGSGLEESRLLAEAAVFAEKADIQEELLRIESHTNQFIETLQYSGPCGRKLDFILQELNREVNTIGSKANAVGISSKVVEMKNELEKMKEQVQNIE